MPDVPNGYTEIENGVYKTTIKMRRLPDGSCVFYGKLPICRLPPGVEEALITTDLVQTAFKDITGEPIDHHEDPVPHRSPARKGGWVGLVVKLRRPLQTRVGQTIAAGTKMVVVRVWNGLQLRMRDICTHCGCGHDHWIKGVDPASVEVLGKDKP